MKILSFDIGIKNLAYCMGEYNEINKKFVINEWNIINLLEDEINSQDECSHISKMKPYKKCSNIAKFRLINNKEFYCKNHVKKNYNYIPPNILNITIDKICEEIDCKKKVKYLVLLLLILNDFLHLLIHF